MIVGGTIDTNSHSTSWAEVLSAEYVQHPPSGLREFSGEASTRWTITTITAPVGLAEAVSTGVVALLLTTDIALATFAPLETDGVPRR